MWTRDSAVWWLAIAGAILTYLAAAPPPTVWTYGEWVQALAFLVATASGKLATSPLPSRREQDQDTWDLPRRPLDRD